MKLFRSLVSLAAVLAVLSFAAPQAEAGAPSSKGEVKTIVLKGVTLRVAKMTLDRNQREMLERLHISEVEICDFGSAGETEASAFIARRRAVYSKSPYVRVGIADEKTGAVPEVYVRTEGSIITSIAVISAENPAKRALFAISCRVSKKDAESLLQSISVH